MRLHCLRIETIWNTSLLIALLFAALISQAAPSLPALPSSTNLPLLTISGKIGTKDHVGKAEFSLAALDNLPQQTNETWTPWHNGVQKFSGPTFYEVLKAVNAQGTNVVVTAINDYASTIPIQELRQYPIILATRINGKTIPIRDKGPLILIYPFDRYPETKNEISYFRSVWNVRAVEVR